MCFGDTAPDYTGAAALEAQAAQQASATEMQMFNQAAGYMAPWRTAGGAAVTQIAGLEGLPGYTAVDPTATLQATPGYKWGLQQGVGAMDASAASRGLALSGPQRLATNQWGQNYGLTQAWQPYLSSLQQLSGQGLSAAGTTAAGALQTGQSTAQNQMAAAAAQAQAMIQQQNAQNQQGAGWMQGLGMLGGLALAPFTGGTSLIGSGISALSSLGGGGGGGMPLSDVYSTGGGNQAFNVSGSGGNMMFTPAMAEGGTALSDKSYIVGEKGPELFIPDESGYIVPNYALPKNNEYAVFAPWRN